LAVRSISVTASLSPVGPTGEVADDGEGAGAGDVHHEGAQAGRHVALRVLDLRPVDREHGDLVVVVARDQRRLAVGRDRHHAAGGLLAADLDGAGGGHRLALDGEDRHGAVDEVGDQPERALPIDGHPRRALARLEGGEHLAAGDWNQREEGPARLGGQRSPGTRTGATIEGPWKTRAAA
jgi:hypothetical protein